MTNKDRKNKVIQRQGNRRHNDIMDRSNKRQGNKGIEDIMTEGTEVIKDRVTREQKTEGHNGQSI